MDNYPDSRKKELQLKLKRKIAELDLVVKSWNENAVNGKESSNYVNGIYRDTKGDSNCTPSEGRYSKESIEDMNDKNNDSVYSSSRRNNNSSTYMERTDHDDGHIEVNKSGDETVDSGFADWGESSIQDFQEQERSCSDYLSRFIDVHTPELPESNVSYEESYAKLNQRLLKDTETTRNGGISKSKLTVEKNNENVIFMG
jgi:hypothetical protein